MTVVVNWKTRALSQQLWQTTNDRYQCPKLDFQQRHFGIYIILDIKQDIATFILYNLYEILCIINQYNSEFIIFTIF